MKHHIGIYLTNISDKRLLISKILQNEALKDHVDLCGLKGALFSVVTLEKMLQEEFLHDNVVIRTDENALLSTMSSGQQRKALLMWQINQNPDYILLDDVYSNLDKDTQKFIQIKLGEISHQVLMIQIFHRKEDLLPFVQQVVTIDYNNEIIISETSKQFIHKSVFDKFSQSALPRWFTNDFPNVDPLIELRNISVHYGQKQVLTGLDWSIRKGEFWQLVGPNGSGKSTLVSLICGDNPKAYGNDMTLFGIKKGSGESVWDIKKHIGYFTPSMIARFTRVEPIEHMIISGLNDSVGLYTEPNGLQKEIANEWVRLIGLKKGKMFFHQLSVGQQRMVMVARAMIKQPPLLILDEPTVGLDDPNSSLFVEMINAISLEREIAIIYISHRDEKNLKPDKIFELIKSGEAYTGRVS